MLTPRQMAERFVDARATARRLLDNRYPFIIAPIGKMLRGRALVMGEGASVLDAALETMRNQRLTDTDRLWILAAVADCCDEAAAARTIA